MDVIHVHHVGVQVTDNDTSYKLKGLEEWNNFLALKINEAQTKLYKRTINKQDAVETNIDE